MLLPARLRTTFTPGLRFHPFRRLEALKDLGHGTRHAKRDEVAPFIDNELTKRTLGPNLPKGFLDDKYNIIS
jgi:hypothetical protein